MKKMSKSRFLQGLQCEKSLYLSAHFPQSEPNRDASTLAVMEQGRMVGIEAQKEFPFGVLIDEPFNRTQAAIERTLAEIEHGTLVIFEATLEYKGVFAKIDILSRPSPTEPWALAEVKSTVRVKDEHYTDVALQLYVALGCGLQISHCYLQHLNKDSTAPALSNLFHREDITSEVRKLLPEIEQNIERLQNVVAQSEIPRVDIGPHCSKPYDCVYQEKCWAHLPEKSVFDFPAIHKEVWDFYRQGITELTDPRFGPFQGTQAKRLEAVRSKKRWVDKPQIKEQLSSWQWPLLYLDFETISPAIPRYAGSHPHEQVPFQFSATLQKKRGGEVEKIDFLHEVESDPRPTLIRALCDIVDKGRCIVAYYKAFEGGVMERLAEGIGGRDAGVLLAAVRRLVDPLPIIRSAVYDPAFGDSFSIKSVAPAILGAEASYGAMDVGDGSAAQRAFMELIDPQLSPKRRAQLRQALLQYCRKDVDVMQSLVDWLFTQLD